MGNVMQIVSKTEKGKRTVTVSGRLVIEEVASAKSDLAEAIAGKTPVVFDLSRVEACDAAGLQLMLMSFASLTSRKVAFQVADRSDAIVQAMVRGGFTCETICPPGAGGGANV